MSQAKVFISYAWGGESEQIVDIIYPFLNKKGYNIIRDKINLGYKGNIKTFMQEIGKGDAIVVVISDKYLRSPNCMYEIVQIQQNGELFERIFPIVLADADIYRASKRVQYIKHWETEVKELNESMKGLDDMSVINEIQEELSEYRQILNSISKITTLLKNMNTLTPQMHQEAGFEPLMKAIDEKLSSAMNSTTQSDKKKSTTNRPDVPKSTNFSVPQMMDILLEQVDLPDEARNDLIAQKDRWKRNKRKALSGLISNQEAERIEMQIRMFVIDLYSQYEE